MAYSRSTKGRDIAHNENGRRLISQVLAKKNNPLLKDLQFKYLDRTLLEAPIHQGVNTSVTLKARLFALIGEVVQIECYTTKNRQGHWLIDGQEIEGDRVIGESI
jgi:hypothetical protein